MNKQNLMKLQCLITRFRKAKIFDKTILKCNVQVKVNHGDPGCKRLVFHVTGKGCRQDVASQKARHLGKSINGDIPEPETDLSGRTLSGILKRRFIGKNADGLGIDPAKNMDHGGVAQHNHLMQPFPIEIKGIQKGVDPPLNGPDNHPLKML